MMTKVTTETGSVYLIDPGNKTWERVTKGALVGPCPLRTLTGAYHSWTGCVIGERMGFCGDSLTPGGMGRIISTSPVVAFEDGS